MKIAYNLFIALDEIRYLKKENIYLIKKQKILDKEISTKKNEIKEINENIIKYDLNKVKILIVYI